MKSNFWQNLGDVLLVASFAAFSVLSIARPHVIAVQIKTSHPRFTGNEAALLRILRIVGIALLPFVALLSIPIFRSLSR